MACSHTKPAFRDTLRGTLILKHLFDLFCIRGKYYKFYHNFLRLFYAEVFSYTVIYS